MDILISYSWSHFFDARREAIGILRRFGDPHPTMEKTSVAGIAVAHTALNSREVIHRCKALFGTEPTFQFAIKWVPVDFWCDTGLEAIKAAIEDKISSRIGADQAWAMVVEKRRWQQYHTREIIDYLAPSIRQKVDLGRPDVIVRVDVVGRRTAISLLKPDEVFSIGASGQP